MKKISLKLMVDIVINYWVGSIWGVGDLYNCYDGFFMFWDEYVVILDFGGLVYLFLNFVFKWGFFIFVVLYCFF